MKKIGILVTLIGVVLCSCGAEDVSKTFDIPITGWDIPNRKPATDFGASLGRFTKDISVFNVGVDIQETLPTPKHLQLLFGKIQHWGVNGSILTDRTKILARSGLRVKLEPWDWFR